MSKYKILCFSPTGNTLFLANKLKDKLNCTVVNYKEKITCDHLIVMSSIHAFRIPNFLKNNIHNVNKVTIIAVGCNTSKINKASGYDLIKFCKKNNIEIMSYNILAMPLTIVKKFDYEYGNKIINESSYKINEIYLNIINNVKTNYNIPLSSKLFSFIHHIENTFVKLFGLELKANKSCIKCGKCVKICPKNNIVLNNKIKFKLKCMMCMACIYKCPVKAIHPKFSKFIEFKNGYNLTDYIKKKDNI